MALNKQELERLMEARESEQVEKCESLKDKEKFSKTICAFANDISNSQKPGVLFIGLTDKGDCANIEITDKKLLNITSIKGDGNIQPMPSFSVSEKDIKNCKLVIVEVQPSKMTPIRYKGQCWIRVGPSVRLATPEDEFKLTEKRQSTDLSYDMQSLSDASADDLDMEYFKSFYLPASIAPDVLKENNRSLTQQMRSLRLWDKNQHPTVCATLILGKNPTNWLPGAFIQFIRFAGKNLTDAVITQKKISGRIYDQIKQTEEVLEAHVSKSLKLSDTIHIETEDYPMTALRQIVRNAIMHRNYHSNTPIRVYWFSDRIEVTSPGGAYGDVKESNFGQEGVTAYRNPAIAEAMKTLGFAEQFGFGIPQAKKALKDNGNPPIEFEVKENFILAKIKPRPDGVEK